MKVKTLRNYLANLPEQFDDFYVKMTKHETDSDKSNIKRSVENIHSAIMRIETKEVFLLDETGADWFDHIGKQIEQKLEVKG
jgi:hypothetical protein